MDDRLCQFFFHRYMMRLGWLVGATEVAVFSFTQQGEVPALRLLAHAHPGDRDTESRRRIIDAIVDLLKPAVRQRTDAVIEVTDGSEITRFCLVRLTGEAAETTADQPEAVVAAIVPCSDRYEAQRRLEVLQRMV